ncbi:MAG: hypothetical protein P1U58_14725 [Verrucomicrobiales bacterium]|nr:hypothetical protein [Verrucomicrobiales bacterium]
MHTVSSTCLERLKPRDFIFIESVLLGPNRGSPDSALRSLFEEDSALLDLLEQDKLFQAIIEIPFPLSISPELYFFVLVRRSFNNAGITELRIADYVAATLAQHAMGSPMADAIPGHPDLDFTYQVDFLEAMEEMNAYDRFFLQVQCGNQFLVLTGLFPKFLEHRASRRGAPGLSYYESVARQAFLAAGEHPLADEFELNRLYPQLADCLIETRHALNRMAEDYLFLGS